MSVGPIIAGGGNANAGATPPAGSSSALISTMLVAIAGGAGTGSYGGFHFTGRANDWDDAGYFQLYGATREANIGNFDADATVAIVPTAGRYRFCVHGRVSIETPSVNLADLWGYAAINLELDPTGAGADGIFIDLMLGHDPAVESDGGNGRNIDATWVSYLDAGGCFGLNTYFSQDGNHDVFEGWVSIEKIG